jgi:hemerythrin-like metal-binding protein
MADTPGCDLDHLLERLFNILQKMPSLHFMPKGAIIMYNPQKKPVRVAHYGLKPACMANDEHDELKEFCAPFCEDAYIIPLSGAIAGDKERICVLPLHNNQHPFGQVLLFTDPAWASPSPDELQFLSDLSFALSNSISRFMMYSAMHMRDIELEDARTEGIQRLGTASEYRDNETGMHVMRMTNFAGSIAKALGLSDEQREILSIAAPMHDVGKIGISDAILLKPGKLTNEEFDIIKSHTEIGGRLLRGSDSIHVNACEIAICHHENWDGSGYPAGLRGEKIPVLARVCAVADVFDALMSERPYKDAWPLEKTVEFIRSESGGKFDPAVVVAFEIALPEILRIRELYRDEVIDPSQTLNLPELPSHETRWISWDESLRVGIDAIDEHHRYLFDLVNDLIDVVANKLGARELSRVLKALFQYAAIHFQAEERMMKQYAYKRQDIQLHQHNLFVERMQKFQEELRHNPFVAQFEILAYVRDWLITHIRDEDSQLSALAW